MVYIIGLLLSAVSYLLFFLILLELGYYNKEGSVCLEVDYSRGI